MTPRDRALAHAAREQHTIAILGAWAERSDWAAQTARVKLRELIPGHSDVEARVTAAEAAALLTAAFRDRDLRRSPKPDRVVTAELRDAFYRDQAGQA